MCKSSLHRECLHCGTDISDKSIRAKFCSKDCRWAANRAATKDERRGKVLFKKYGITEADWDAMYVDQEGDCLVCGTHMTAKPFQLNSAHVDHCHTTGEVHGLLCARCNQAAGLLGENPEITAKLTAYLLDTGKVPTR